MAIFRRTKASYFFILLVVLIVLYLVRLLAVIRRTTPIDFTDFDNVVGSTELIVPNMVHFIHFDSEKIGFIAFICILSVHYNHRPAIIFLHTNVDLRGRYYKTLVSIIGPKLKMVRTSKPSHVFGQKLSSVQHAADVARLKILMQYGGIALDEDVFVVKSLNEFRHFEVSLGWPKGQNLGSQVIVAHKQARLLPLWLALYREYRPSMWYYNAGESPTHSILEKQPGLVHRAETQFGVENLAVELYTREWPGWRERHAIHLLARHQGYLTNTTEITEENYTECHCTAGTMVASVMEVAKEEDIIWSGEWLRLNDDAEDVGLREAVAQFLHGSSTSLLHRHLTLELFDQLEQVRTPAAQGSLGDQIRSGLTRPSSAGLGLRASDPEAYTYFSRLYSPVIRAVHGVRRGKLEQPPVYWGDPGAIGSLGPGVLSARLEVVRAVQGFPFNNKMTIDDYLNLEQAAMEAFSSLPAALAGTYLSLASLAPGERAELQEQGLLPPACDEDLAAAGACRHWPAGRGVFISKDRAFLVWVGGEEHLRVASHQPGGALGTAYGQLVEGLAALEAGGLAWVHNSALGFLTSSPARLGTGLTAALRLRPTVLSPQEARRLAEAEGLRVRGVAGQDARLLELANSRVLGITEFQVVDGVYRAVGKLLEKDKKMTNG